MEGIVFIWGDNNIYWSDDYGCVEGVKFFNDYLNDVLEWLYGWWCVGGGEGGVKEKEVVFSIWVNVEVKY